MRALAALKKYLIGNLGLLLLFIVMECVVLATWNAFRIEKGRAAGVAFNDMTSDLTSLLKNSLNEKAQVLAGLKGLYDASDQVDDDEFRAYVEGQSVGVAQTGVSGFHHALVDSSAILATNRLIPSLSVAKDNSEFGVAWSEVLALPSVIEAAEFAVKNNTIAVTGVLKEPYFNTQMLMLIAPIYKKGAVVFAHQGSWDSVEGVVYISYRMSELMSRLVVNITQSADMHVYSGADINDDALLLDTRPDLISENQSKYNKVVRFSLFGKTFTVLVYSKDEFEDAYTNRFSYLVILLGSLLNIFLIMLLKLFLSRAEVARGIAVEMTKDLQHKHHELTLSESRFRLALEMSTMGAWMWHLDSNEINWDASIYPVFGIDKSTPLKTYEDFLALIHTDDREKVFNQIASAIENKTPFDSEYRIPVKGGGFRYIASRAQIIFNDENQTFVMAGTCWDVTERKRLDKLKTEFVSTVSHELRTPLTAISGALGLAVGGALGNLDDKTKSILDIANKNAQRLKLLINDLLDMDKLLAGKLEFHCEPCFVIHLLERSVAENQAYADQFNVRIIIAKFDHSFKINVEEPRFLQVMANFLSNAASFRPTMARSP